MLLFGFMSPVSDAANRRPYFKTFGADVMTGGWFSEGTVCNTDGAGNTYQDAASASDNLSGGIISYTKSNGADPLAAGGASSEFAAFVMGLIEGNTGLNRGFYSNGISAGSKVASRTFANNSASATPWGGLFQDNQVNGVRQSYCIPDYYSKLPSSVIPVANGSFDGTPSPGIYKGTAPTGGNFVLRNGEIIIDAGRRVTVFIDGNLYINNNIRYNLDTVNNIPKFTVVVRGSIYIGPEVTELNGFYIAQPLPQCASGVSPCSNNPVTGDTGIIWTCHPNNTDPVNYEYPVSNCHRKLTINGSLTAKQVNFLRIGSNDTADVANATTADDNLLSAINTGNTRIAEVINYSPAIPLDGPFFGYTNSAGQRNKIDSVISLPPVF